MSLTQHRVVFCDSKDVESIPCALPAFLQTCREKCFLSAIKSVPLGCIYFYFWSGLIPVLWEWLCSRSAPFRGAVRGVRMGEMQVSCPSHLSIAGENGYCQRERHCADTGKIWKALAELTRVFWSGPSRKWHIGLAECSNTWTTLGV